MEALPRRLLTLARAVADDYGRTGTSQFAAAISYRALFSLVPLVTFVVTVAGLFLQDDSQRQRFVDTVAQRLDLSAGGVTSLDRIVNDIPAPWSLVGLIALVVALWGATGVMSSVRKALAVIYDDGVTTASPAGSSWTRRSWWVFCWRWSSRSGSRCWSSSPRARAATWSAGSTGSRVGSASCSARSSPPSSLPPSSRCSTGTCRGKTDVARGRLRGGGRGDRVPGDPVRAELVPRGAGRLHTALRLGRRGARLPALRLSERGGVPRRCAHGQ